MTGQDDNALFSKKRTKGAIIDQRRSRQQVEGRLGNV
jgi:hypothetical protein